MISCQIFSNYINDVDNDELYIFGNKSKQFFTRVFFRQIFSDQIEEKIHSSQCHRSR